MKKIILILSVFLLIGCDDFLDTESKTKKDSSNFPETPDDADQYLTGAYAELTDTYPLQLLFYAGELMSDNCLGGGGSSDTDCKDINNFQSNGKVDRFRNAWKHNYKGIFRCNNLITNMYRISWGESEAELARKSRITGEIHFLRAHYYFDMVRLFERVPLVLTPEPVNLPQATPDELYAQIASDLKLSIESLSDTKYSTEYSELHSGRITKWAAEGMMAKVFLFYTGYYQKETLPLTNGEEITKAQVIDWLVDCIDNSGHKLVDDFRTLWPYSYIQKDYNYVKKNKIGTWVKDGNIETVFSVKYSSIQGSWDDINKRTNQVCLYYGPRSGGPDNYFEATYPLGRGWGQGTVNSKLFEDWPDEDLRKKGSILDITDPIENIWTDPIVPTYYMWGADSQEEETGLWNKKYVPINKDRIAPTNYNIELYGAVSDYQWNNLQDLVIMRFADILLMAAELGAPEAKQYLNMVRQRAGYTDEVEPTLENIMNERRFELAFEGVRYYDLLRWHKTDLLDSNQKNIKVKNQGVDATVTVNFRPETRGFLPIPEAEIALSNNVLTQNQGW
ncbi:RagB/SusD family nutrient uptake outer membrane protein [Dysgonomonas sp. 520]|uniref:RagB/SusD family nutrient uptake outer membrane protein n=1 Tax=Dysgonomonas sp. 520 TaxID=2302931 RepID=UPI0013D5458B|nr:RagB/SusD family nutrient uptake outer membrane protein [Dysgonomonas sp. 520]NDW10184.1 RagB/SusD family nutrient uptake outer membrane protein [Dysgonomonas sp. 520]